MNECYGCTERKHKCHSECDRYKAFKEKSERARKERLQEESIKIYQVDQKNKALKDKRNHKLWKREMRKK